MKQTFENLYTTYFNLCILFGYINSILIIYLEVNHKFTNTKWLTPYSRNTNKFHVVVDKEMKYLLYILAKSTKKKLQQSVKTRLEFKLLL